MSKAVNIKQLPSHNYLRKLQRMMRAGKLKAEPGMLYDVTIKHDDACDFLRGGRCNCDPTITQTLTHGPYSVSESRHEVTR